MATLQSTGIGSGLDVNGLVTQLVAAERAPKQNQIIKQQTQVAARISAMGSLKGALGAFQSALASLKTTDVFASRSATSSNQEIFTVAATSSATPSSYGIEVTQLAKAHQLTSDAFVDSTTAIGTGLLTFAVGEASFTINVTDENATLANIRDAINGASDNVGVQAAIVQAADGAHLVLSSSKTGVANVISVTTSEGDGGLSALTYAPDDLANYLELKPAQDSIIQIAGYEHRSDSNTVSTAIEGVTLTLLKAEPDTEVDLTVKLDRDAPTARINNFVAQYNQLAKTIATLQSYDAATKKAGPLLGDALLRGIESELRNSLVTPVEGASEGFSTLASLGITTQKDGTLKVDSAKLTAALDANFVAIGELFGSENGLAARLDSKITARLAATGEIAARTTTLDQRVKSLSEESVRLDARMAVVQQRYLKQFIALDVMLGQMQQTSSYLTQQLASLPKIGQ